MKRDFHLIGAPSSAGAYAAGQEKAPAAFRRHGLVPSLSKAGLQVADRGDVEGFRWRPDLANPKAMNVDVVRRVAGAVADQVAEALVADGAVLVLGGDCTVELGTVSGALRGSQSVGLVHIDFDADLNPPEESDGALDWTGVAHMLDIPGAASQLAALGPQRPLLLPSDVMLFAVENVTEGEAETIRKHGIQKISLSQVKADPREAARQALAWAARYERLLIHFDVDVLAYVECPIAENVRRCDGLSLEEIGIVLGTLLKAPNWRALTITEVNPDHAPDEAEIFDRMIAMLARSLGDDFEGRERKTPCSSAGEGSMVPAWKCFRSMRTRAESPPVRSSSIAVTNHSG
jgi:arginase